MNIKTVPDLETFWQQELGESVEIIPVGWNEWPSEYALYLGGTNVASFRLLEDLEDYLSRYSVLKGD